MALPKSIYGTSGKNLPANAGNKRNRFDPWGPLGEIMATHSSILAWGVPWTEEPGRLQSTGLQKSWTRLSAHTNKGYHCSRIFSDKNLHFTKLYVLYTFISFYAPIYLCELPFTFVSMPVRPTPHGSYGQAPWNTLYFPPLSFLNIDNHFRMLLSGLGAH